MCGVLDTSPIIDVFIVLKAFQTYLDLVYNLRSPEMWLILWFGVEFSDIFY